VLALVLAGYAFVVVAALLFVALAAGLGARAVDKSNVLAAIGAVVCGAAAYTIARSLRVPPEPTPGLPLGRPDAPALFEMVDRIGERLGCPRPPAVLLTGDGNASADAASWTRSPTPLHIGLPLLLALSPQEVEAVVAHELGHVSRAHGGHAAWIYRVRCTWERLLERLAQRQSWLSLPFGAFCRWYAPRLGASSLVLARAYERQADRDAAALTGPGVLASALARTALAEMWLSEHFWPELFREAAQEPEPSPRPFSRMEAALNAAAPALPDRLGRVLAWRTMYWDTHPSLRERIDLVGAGVPVLAPLDGGHAARALLGPAAATLTTRLETVWRDAVAPQWRERHQQLEEGKRRLAVLASAGRELGAEEAAEQAGWIEELSGEEAALPAHRSVLERFPAHRPTQFAVGRILVSRDDAAGVPLLEEAMQDPLLRGPACELLHWHFSCLGDHAAADEYHRRAAAHADLLEQATPERTHVGSGDTLLPHELPAPALVGLQKQIAEYPEVAEAYLVRKRVTLFPEKPCFVVAFVRKIAWYKLTSPEASARLTQKLAEGLRFQEPLLVISLDLDAKLRRKVRAVKGARFHPAAADAT
jgi:Zn-dependent protease with chaperone function